MTFLQQVFKGKNEWWRYVLGLLVILLGWQLFGIIPLVVVAITYAQDLSDFQRTAADNFSTLGIDNNLYLFSVLLMFAIGLLSIVWVVRFIHKRSFTSLITSRKKIDWKRFAFAFGLWFLFSTTMIFIDYYSDPEAFIWNFKPVPFMFLLLVSFVVMPLQTSFEEVLFRGYLMQGLGGLFKKRGFPLLITSVAFGVLHGFNPEVEKLGAIILVYYIGTGFLFGITTLMDEGLELSLGMHAANNIAAALFVTTNWTVFQTDALFIDTSEPSLGLEMLVPVFVIYPMVLWILSKRYHWKDWKAKLVGEL